MKKLKNNRISAFARVIALTMCAILIFAAGSALAAEDEDPAAAAAEASYASVEMTEAKSAQSDEPDGSRSGEETLPQETAAEQDSPQLVNETTAQADLQEPAAQIEETESASAVQMILMAEDSLPSGKYELSAAMKSFSSESDSSHWHEAIFEVDAEAKTIHTIDKKTGAQKGTGTYEFDGEAGEYTITYTADTSAVGKTTRFTYEDDGITFIEPVKFGMAQLALTDSEGNFTPYTAYRNDNAKVDTQDNGETIDTTGMLTGSGNVENKGYEPLLAWNDYVIKAAVRVDSSNVITEIIVSGFEVDKEERLGALNRFAKMALDGTDKSKGLRSQLIGKDAGDVKKMSTDDIDIISSATCTSRGLFAAVQDALPEPASEPENPQQNTGALADGVYKAEIKKTAMGNEITYQIEAAFEKGQFTYKVTTSIPAQEYEETVVAKGTYSVDEKGSISLTDEKGWIKSGTVVDDYNISLHGKVSGFAFEDSDFTVTRDGAPAKDNDNKESEETKGSEENPADTNKTETEPGNTGKPETPSAYADENGLKSGTYELTEESYDDSAAMKMPVDIILDMEKGTFQVFNKNGENKGAGTITYDDKSGEYVMTYTSGGPEKRDNPTSRFTAADDAITFTTPILIGSAGMNIVDENGKFIPYTAHLKKTDDSKEPSGSKEEETKAPDYRFVEGGNATVAQGADNTFTFRVRDMNGSGEFAKFKSLQVNGETISEDKYQKKEGSVIITMNADYMKSLAAGTYKVKAVFADGEAETSLTVRSASSAQRSSTGSAQTTRSTTTRSTSSRSNPKTGDFEHIWLFIIAAAGAAFLMTAAIRRFIKGK